jgi:uncharacterized glyoxalase superfamily metalloenzyme YdcJ
MSESKMNKLEMQRKLFSELSTMFGREVPLYDRSLAINFLCNRAVCDLLSERYAIFSIRDEMLERTGGERHGAIRIGRPDEYQLIARFFGCFDMEPHGFYDMTTVGSKSQPIIATAFRSEHAPEHRVFTSLLVTDYFDEQTKDRIETALSTRKVFSDLAISLIGKSEHDGGLSAEDADLLIREATNRIFKWTGHASNYGLYKELCDGGFKIAADIACFERHHLNHLTPNTLCIDLYVAAMKFCLGGIDLETFIRNAGVALERLLAAVGPDWITLHFKHLSCADAKAICDGPVHTVSSDSTASSLLQKLLPLEVQLRNISHSGFKEFTEGPGPDTPILLRQDAYKALTEPVIFHEPDGTTVSSGHTARFGEIEQRFYATTRSGRAIYDECLEKIEKIRSSSSDSKNGSSFEDTSLKVFEVFPNSLEGLLKESLVYACYSPTPLGIAKAGTIDTCDFGSLCEQGYIERIGQRYEDFLPVSAAGIFASNLNQYGTARTATKKPYYCKEQLEAIMGKCIVDIDAVYERIDAQSRLRCVHALGIAHLVHRRELERLMRLVEDVEVGK